MTYAIIMLFFLITFTYRRQVTGKSRPDKKIWQQYQRILALLAMTILPVILVNMWIPDRLLTTPQERIDFGREHDQPVMVSHAYRELCERYPDSLELQFDYIDILVDYHNYYFSDFDFSDRLYRPETQVMLKAYAQAVSRATVREEPFWKQLSANQPYAGYVRALYDYEKEHLIGYAQKRALVNDWKINPQKKRTSQLLWRLYVLSGDTELDRLMLDSERAQYIDEGFCNDYYFAKGYYGLYISNILRSRLGDVEWLTLLASLLVSLVWVIFLRSMDVFNREKWGPIILVFLGGAFFTFFCLPIYDYVKIYLHFGIDGTAWNDFLYCVTVIGGGEELVKLIPWVLFAAFSRRMKEPYDYILYASVSALGFAFTENLIYLSESGNIVTRTIMSSVGHMFFASIVAYSLILARYRYRKIVWKILTPVIGFVIAAAAHGFYDFWLISESVAGYHFFTLIFFLGSLHVWFFFKNNALNNSGFFSGSQAYNSGFQQDLLTFSLLGVLIVEFVFVSLEYGADDGNRVIHSKAILVFFFLIYLSLILQQFNLQRGVWRKWRFRVPDFFRGLLTLPQGSNDMEDHESDHDFIGLQLRLFAPKSNPYIGEKLPKSGTCVKHITVSGNPNWYVLQLNSPIHYGNMVSTHIIIKNKLPHQLLNEPKIEIYFMFIPDIFLIDSPDLDIRQLRYAGRAYSMPV